MDIIFFGSSHFGLPSLKALINARHRVSCVVTQPDRKKGRGMLISKTAIKEFAEVNKIKIYQPENINTAESAAFLKQFNPELFIVIAYGQILSQELLNIPLLLPLNLHGSLLPLYRGAAPINWAIINGEKETGITAIKMTPQMDAGPMIAKKTIAIGPEDDFVLLENKLSRLAAALVIETLELIAKGDYKLAPQQDKSATFAPKLKKENGLIDWEQPASRINNLIRGLSIWPAAFTHYNGKLLKITKARADTQKNSGQPGQIAGVSRGGIVVAAGKGSLIIERLQLEGKKEISAGEFVSGHKISPADKLG